MRAHSSESSVPGAVADNDNSRPPPPDPYLPDLGCRPQPPPDDRPPTPATPLIRIHPQLLCKAEHFQPGFSHKARAARAAILAAERSGAITADKGDILVDKSGGNFAIALMAFASPSYQCHFLVRPGFSGAKRRMLTSMGAVLFGTERIADGWGNQDIIDEYTEKLTEAGLAFFYIDQFNNPAAIEGHRAGALELADQLRSFGLTPRDSLNFIATIGSGAHCRAYSEVLREEFPLARIIVAQPEGCDVAKGIFCAHPVQGVAVGAKPPMFRPGMVDDYVPVAIGRLDSASKELQHKGLFCGPSTQLAYAAASEAQRKHPDVLTVFLAYDGGEFYFADTLSSGGE